jgi:alpha-beta hydrolase superfamily lysophospholipase
LSSLPPPRLFWLGDGDMAIACIARGPIMPSATLIVVQPFAEEMNRCRLWLTRTSIILAQHKIQTVIFDVPGTGDSPRAFFDSCLADWIAATRRTISSLAKTAPVYLFGVRFGALLAAAAADSSVDELILAAPVEDGASTIRAILRTGNVAELTARLSSIGSVDVAGYSLNHQLAKDISGLKLAHLLKDAAMPVTRLTLSHLPQPWLQIEPEEPDALAEETSRQLLACMTVAA